MSIIKVKKIKIFLILAFLILPLSSLLAQEQNKFESDQVLDSFQIENEKINLYFFYGNGCPHCAKEEIFLDKLEQNEPDIEIKRYEVWYNRENSKLLAKIAQELDLQISGVPLLIIGDQTVSGYRSDKITGQKIKEIITYYRENQCNDLVKNIINPQLEKECSHECDQNHEECPHDCGCKNDQERNKISTSSLKKINIPILGEIEIKNFSLPFLTFIIAGVDGFNPCAMWVLLFLINMLIGMKDKVRMWSLGIAFILSSGLVYFFFLSAWLNFFLFIGFIFWIRLIIGLIASASGIYHLREYFKNKNATCHVSNNEKRKAVFEKIRKSIKQKNFWLALIGIILLAMAVNLIELVCSAGLPAIYTQLLSISDLSKFEYYAYLVFYILIFMLDDLLIFFIAMITLEIKGISVKYSRWANLIGGIIMIIIGILLIFKPGWLMI